MSEEWKPVLGYEGYYVASTEGRIARITTFGKSARPAFRVLKKYAPRDGYLYCILCKEKNRKTFRVHRVIWQAFNGPIEGRLEVNHINSDRGDNRLCNLELMTRSQNSAYAYSHNARPRQAPRMVKGSKTYNAKITEEAVPVMRELARQGMTYREIGERYGVTMSVAYRCVIGKTWRHVP